MQSSDNNYPISHKHIIYTLLFIGLVTISCTFPSFASSDPMFKAPQGADRWTDTPVPPTFTPEPNHTTPEPVHNQLSTSIPTPTPTYDESVLDNAPILYYAQAGDTLPVVAIRFGVESSEIASPDPLPDINLLNPGQLLIIPNRLENTTSSQHLIPDSEVVFSPSAIDFDIAAYIADAGGFLNTYSEWLFTSGVTSGAKVISRVAIENSINPRLILALLEYESGWVYGFPEDASINEYPMGFRDDRHKRLYHQLTWAVNQLASGYYGWREGRLTEIHFSDGISARLAPDLNAGTTGLQYYFAQRKNSTDWLAAIDPAMGLPALHERMFGNPWMRAQTVEPLYPPNLQQPALILPFQENIIWGFTGGPHGAWERDGAWAAIDFGPGSDVPGSLQEHCEKSNAWVVSSAAGLVIRSGDGIVVIDMDGDGREQTGWVLFFLHIATDGRIPNGAWVEAGDRIGHPSCEGGFSTGTHIHFARKYNGEWIVADGPLPFVLSGWFVTAGDKPYEGTLTKDGKTIPASPLGIYASRIIRTPDSQ